MQPCCSIQRSHGIVGMNCKFYLVVFFSIAELHWFLRNFDWTFTPLRCGDHEDPEPIENKQGQSASLKIYSMDMSVSSATSFSKERFAGCCACLAHRSAVLRCNNSVCWDKGLQISLSQSEYFFYRVLSKVCSISILDILRIHWSCCR